MYKGRGDLSQFGNFSDKGGGRIIFANLYERACANAILSAAWPRELKRRFYGDRVIAIA